MAPPDRPLPVVSDIVRFAQDPAALHNICINGSEAGAFGEVITSRPGHQLLVRSRLSGKRWCGTWMQEFFPPIPAIGSTVRFSDNPDILDDHCIPRTLAGETATLDEIKQNSYEVMADDWRGIWLTHFFPVESIQPKSGLTAHHHICPLCGKPGDDLVFAFYCSNSVCNNWRPPFITTNQTNKPGYPEDPEDDLPF